MGMMAEEVCNRMGLFWVRCFPSAGGIGMSDRIRKSGIGIGDDVPWGTHFCKFYQTKEDLFDILTP